MSRSVLACSAPLVPSAPCWPPAVVGEDAAPSYSRCWVGHVHPRATISLGLGGLSVWRATPRPTLRPPSRSPSARKGTDSMQTYSHTRWATGRGGRRPAVQAGVSWTCQGHPQAGTLGSTSGAEGPCGGTSSPLNPHQFTPEPLHFPAWYGKQAWTPPDVLAVGQSLNSRTTHLSQLGLLWLHRQTSSSSTGRRS